MKGKKVPSQVLKTQEAGHDLRIEPQENLAKVLNQGRSVGLTVTQVMNRAEVDQRAQGSPIKVQNLTNLQNLTNPPKAKNLFLKSNLLLSSSPDSVHWLNTTQTTIQ